jgi:hypothetical protein
MLDVQRTQPALLAHGQRYEIADFDQLRSLKCWCSRAQNVVDRQIPGDRLCIGQRCLLLRYGA